MVVSRQPTPVRDGGSQEEEADALIAMSFRNVPAGHRLAEDETQTALQLLSEYTLPDGILSPPTADPRSDGVSSAEIAIDQAEEAAAAWSPCGGSGAVTRPVSACAVLRLHLIPRAAALDDDRVVCLSRRARWITSG